MDIGKTIRIYLASGSVSGIRHAEIVNWTGQAISSPRTTVKALNAWEEAHKPGVYFLFGDDPETSQPAVYIGEAESVYDRLLNHLANKDFWNEVTLITSKDENLTKSHVKYLESKLIRLAKAAGREPLLNSTEPQEPTLPRGDRASMDEFVINIRTLLGTLGHKTLDPLGTPSFNTTTDAKPPSATAEETQQSQSMEVQLKVNNISAHGLVTNEGLVVLEGSEFCQETKPSLSEGYRKLRQRLIDNSVVATTPNSTQYKFVKRYVFSSPSQAAAVIVGTSINGRWNWKLADGRSIKEYEEG